MNFDTIYNYYFLGIGGIGMSALARYFNGLGKNVCGYDKTQTTLTCHLEMEGIAVHYDEDINQIDQRVLNDKEHTLIIITPAIPQDNKELQYFQQNNFTIMKRAAVLGEITDSKLALAIAGSHGKTTVTTMTAHILNSSPLKCNAFLGGISKNLDSNLLVSEHSNFIVVEADEYDRSFLKLNPHIALITAMDADHLDIYGTKEEMIKSYCQFTEKIVSNGTLIVKKGIEHIIPKREGIKYFTYALNTQADYYATNIRAGEKNKLFDIKTPEGIITNLTLDVPGLLNIENATAAVSIALNAGVPEEYIRAALAKFSGVKRRFDIHVNTKEHVYIDDYAHHPEEIRAFVTSVRDHFPDRKITGIFQPHLYSRTRDFADDFAKSLSLLDELILLDIYPARELPIPGVTSQIVFDKVTIPHKTLANKQSLYNVLAEKQIDVLLTMGAGNIDNEIGTLQQFIMQKQTVK